MARLRHNRLLLILTALLFAAGYGEQVFGRFEAHHHHGAEVHSDATVESHEGEQHHGEDGDGQRDADHRLDHLAAIGTLPPVVFSLIVNVEVVALVEWRAVNRTEAPVLGIDYPPQLA